VLFEEVFFRIEDLKIKPKDFGRTKPARVGAAHGLVVESFPIRGSSENCLSDISHMRKGVLKLSHLSVEPALAAAVSCQVRF
jgi:hypothetical protein